jgi:spore maturation protein CgeB
VGDHLETNLRALAARNPARARMIAAAAPLAAPVEATPAGQPTLAADGVLLHSRRDPVREAAAWVARHRESLEDVATAAVLGFGLGYHVEGLAAAWSGRIVVIEPDAGLLRSAFAARDLRPLLARIELAGDPLESEAIDAWGRTAVLAHAPSLLREGTRLRALQQRIAGRTGLRAVRLRILVVSPLGGGSHPITGYCARALSEMGHGVTVLDLAPFAAGMDAIGGFSPRTGARRAVEASYCRFLGDGVLAAIEAVEPDLLLAMAQAPLVPPVLAEVRRRGVPSAFWFVEDHRLFGYWKELIGAYDYFFTIQSGAFLAEAERLSTGHVAYLPCAADRAVHRPLALTAAERDELGAPVGFVGAGYRNRRLAFRSLLDLGLRIWGSEWGGAGVLDAAVQRDGARIATEEAVRIFNATAVNLNLHSSTYVDGVDPRGDFVNPRTFEIAAAGGFQLVDLRGLLPPLLRPEVEVATFADAAELRDRVRHWLAHPAERTAIAAAGRARVLAEHTYRHRMETLLETICAHDSERLRARAGTAPTVADAARAEGATALGGLLRRLPPATPFTLDGVVREVIARDGDLSDPEAIVLFLHQFDEMYVREARA